MKTAVSHTSRLLAYILTTMILFNTSAFVQGATRIASVSGNWDQTTTWGGANVPKNNDDVIINNGITVTINIADASCKTLTINGSCNNNGILNVSTSISGTGSLTNNATGTLNLGGTTTITTLNAMANGNTINYNGAAQTVKAITYYNLTLSGSGIKTTTGIIVNGILSMEGTATASATPTYGAAATLQYNTATARPSGVEWVSPFVATGGIIIANTGTITMNASKTMNAPLIINSGATLTISGNTLAMTTALLTIQGNLINAGGATSGSSGVLISGTAATQNIGSFTTTGLVSMTKTAGTATFTGNVNGGALTINGAGGTLNLGTGYTHTFSGIVTLTAGSLNGGSSTLNENAVSTTAWNGNGSVFVPGTGTIIFGANGNQTISATGTLTFNNLIFNNNGVSNLPNATITCNTLRVNQNFNGTTSLYFGSSSRINVSGIATIGGTAIGYKGTIDMGAGGVLECSSIALGIGTGGLTSGLGTVQLDANNSLPLGTFYNLIIKNGTTTLSRNISVYGDLTFGLSGTDGTIDQSASNFSIDLYGDMINNNTSAQNFASQNGNINCKGGAGVYGKTDQYINTNGQIYNLEINKPSGTVYYQGTDFHPYGSVSIMSGSLSLVAATQFTVEGNLTITGTLDLPSTLVFPLMIIVPPVRGVLTLSSNSTLNIRGSSDYAFPYSTNTIMDPTSTVNYCYMGDQYIAGLFLTYGNLKLSGSGIKHLHFPTNVKGNITTENTAYFDAVTYSTTITLNGASPQTITNARFYNLIVNNSYLGNGITLNSNDSVAHQLTCTKGIVDATSHPLLFEAGATVTGANDASHVKGIVKKITNLNESFDFPVGDGIFYRPIGIVNPSANTWTASYSSNSFSNITAIKQTDPVVINHVSDIEYWDLSPQTAGSAKIKLSWADMSKVTNPANLLIAHWSSSNSYWENVGTVTIDTGNKTVTSNNSWSSFSPFTLGSNSNDGSLPVELIEFKAHKR